MVGHHPSGDGVPAGLVTDAGDLCIAAAGEDPDGAYQALQAAHHFAVHFHRVGAVAARHSRRMCGPGGLLPHAAEEAQTAGLPLRAEALQRATSAVQSFFAEGQPVAFAFPPLRRDRGGGRYACPRCGTPNPVAVQNCQSCAAQLPHAQRRILTLANTSPSGLSLEAHAMCRVPALIVTCDDGATDAEVSEWALSLLARARHTGGQSHGPPLRPAVIARRAVGSGVAHLALRVSARDEARAASALSSMTSTKQHRLRGGQCSCDPLPLPLWALPAPGHQPPAADAVLGVGGGTWWGPAPNPRFASARLLLRSASPHADWPRLLQRFGLSGGGVSTTPLPSPPAELMEDDDDPPSAVWCIVDFGQDMRMAQSLLDAVRGSGGDITGCFVYPSTTDGRRVQRSTVVTRAGVRRAPHAAALCDAAAPDAGGEPAWDCASSWCPSAGVNEGAEQAPDDDAPPPPPQSAAEVVQMRLQLAAAQRNLRQQPTLSTAALAAIGAAAATGGVCVAAAAATALLVAEEWEDGDDEPPPPLPPPPLAFLAARYPNGRVPPRHINPRAQPAARGQREHIV